MKIVFSITLVCCMINLSTKAQTVIPLWKSIPPGNIKHQVKELREESLSGAKVLSGVSIPELWFFKSNNQTKCPAIIICPGGGYAKEAYEHEGTQVAQWLNELGIHAFVLKYRLPDNRICNNSSYVPLMDAQRAIQLVRDSAESFQIDNNRIGIMGFSAGGHLAASCSNLSEPVIDDVHKPIRPDFSILLYPVISMKTGLTHEGSRNNLLGKNPNQELIHTFSMEKQVSSKTPPTFICHAKDDQAVVVQNTIVYVKALKEHGIDTEVHLLEEGGHGFGMHNDSPAFIWTKYLKTWLEKNIL